MTYVQTPSNAQLSLAATFLAAVGAQLRALDAAFSEDDALFLDTLEGETGDIFDKIDLAFAAVDDLETSAAVCAARRKVLAEREARLTARAEGLRAGLINIMQVLGQTSLNRSTYTASIGKARQSVEVSDVELLPAGCFKTTKAPDKLAIKALLETNTAVPGAALVTDSPSLTIRSK